MSTARPHVLGIDDGPFDKHQTDDVPVIGVLMEGADLVEAVCITRFPVDGDGATKFLADWIAGLRLKPSVQAVVLGGITIAGLGVVDAAALSRALDVPVLVVTRKNPAGHRLGQALRAAGLEERMADVERASEAFEFEPGLWLACAGIERESAGNLLRTSRAKSKLPEALRVAHLVGAALVSGASRGRA